LYSERDIDKLASTHKARISRFIHQNVHSKPKLADLALEISLSPSRASHLVKELFGKSFTELVMEERVRRAKTLLLSTDDSLGEIAANIGIPDEYHFNKFFKKNTGTPPGRFRKLGKPH
jgi:YesN/AraC family two-component response regulator